MAFKRGQKTFDQFIKSKRKSMNKHHSYRDIVESKLAQLPTADADLLWNDMHAILDKEMPQKKERRRFIAWFLSGKGLVMMSFGSLIITSAALFFSSANENTQVLAEKIHGSRQTHQINEKGVATISRSAKESATGTTELDQITKENIRSENSTSLDLSYVNNNSFLPRQIRKESNEPTTTGQFTSQTEVVAKTRENSEIDLVELTPIHYDLHISPNYHKERISVTPPWETTAKKKANNGRNNQSGFYAGILIGADLSSVQFQSARSGATAGFILGYALNQRWSIESGLLWDTKRVYDDGTNFNPPGYTPTNGVAITAVNGKSRLHEWPVNIKYTIKSGAHSFFATTGLSSYFMKLENYDYEYTLNNQPGGHNYLSYKNETKDWFGVVNFSAGYSHKLGNSGHIRIEPYLKVPINSIGVANMPIMSTGLNIGITKPLRR
jgi:hypothetical protein